jgi:hypothetical protein
MKRAYKKHECTLGCEKPRCIKRQRDDLLRENDALNRRLNNQLETIKHLQEQLDKASNTSRHWVLRKLGL